jgi:hypothetical protein
MASVDFKQLIPVTALTDNLTGETFNLEMYQSKFVGVLTVSACNAATTVACVIEHSGDGTNWATVGTFTNVVGAAAGNTVQIDDGAVHLLPQVRGRVTLSGATKAATVGVRLFYDKV